MKSKFILVGAIVFAIATTVLFSNYVKGLDNKYKNDKNMAQVVVLKQDVKKYQQITGDMLEKRAYNASSVLPNSIKTTKDVIGSYTLIDMKAGELLFPDRFTNQTEEKAAVTKKIKEGSRAVSVGVSYESSVSTMIEPEDYVDVIQNIKNGNTYVTSTVLQNVRVLAVGETLTESQNTNAQAKSNGSQAKYSAITLELTPQQAEQIANAEKTGDLKFELRSKLEQK